MVRNDISVASMFALYMQACIDQFLSFLEALKNYENNSSIFLWFASFKQSNFRDLGSRSRALSLRLIGILRYGADPNYGVSQHHMFCCLHLHALTSLYVSRM